MIGTGIRRQLSWVVVGKPDKSVLTKGFTLWEVAELALAVGTLSTEVDARA